MILFYDYTKTDEINGFQKSKIICSVRYKGDSKTEQVSKLRPSQEKVVDEVNEQILDSLRSDQGATPYEGQRVANMPGDFGDNFDAFLEQMRQTTEAVQASIQDAVVKQSNYNTDFDQTVQNWREKFASPVMAMYDQEIKPTVEEQFNLPGVFNSTTKARNVTKNKEDFYKQKVTPSLFNAFQADEQRAFEGVQRDFQNTMAGNSFMADLPFSSFSQQYQAAEMAKANEQSKLDADYSEFLRGAPENSPWLRLAQGFGFTPSFDTVVEQGSDSGPGYAQAGATAALAYAMSDIKVKENIKPKTSILKRIKNLNLYSYNYKEEYNFGNPEEKRLGLIAQEVEKVFPEAVREINGIKHIDNYALQSIIIAALAELSETEQEK